jgi:hypothetical protein
MILGQILFLLAVLAILAGSLVGLGIIVGKVIVYPLLGRPVGPQPALGSTEWAKGQASGHVDVRCPSLLTERYRHTTDDPVVELEGDRYRVTRMAGGRFLITQVQEGRRIGTFELSGEGSHADVIPSPDDPSQQDLLLHVAVLSSHVRRDAGRIVHHRDHDDDGRNAPTSPSHH